LLFEGDAGADCNVEFAESLVVGDGCSFIGELHLMLRKGLAKVAVDVGLELVSRSGIAHFDCV
jgi:hypothetical protein